MLGCLRVPNRTSAGRRDTLEPPSRADKQARQRCHLQGSGTHRTSPNPLSGSPRTYQPSRGSQLLLLLGVGRSGSNTAGLLFPMHLGQVRGGADRARLHCRVAQQTSQRFAVPAGRRHLREVSSEWARPSAADWEGESVDRACQGLGGPATDRHVSQFSDSTALQGRVEVRVSSP